MLRNQIYMSFQQILTHTTTAASDHTSLLYVLI